MIIYYVLDGSPKHAFQFKISVESIRKHNQNINIKLFSYQSSVNKEFCDKFDIELIQKPSSDLKCFLKWDALSEIKSNEILYLDADTFCLDDPKKLKSNSLFSARREVLTESNTHLININKFHELQKTLGSIKFPIFSNGVMKFNINYPVLICKKIFEFKEMFERNKRLYPSFNIHIMDEVCSSLSLGIQQTEYKFFEPKEVSFFQERNLAKIILHTWTSNYPKFLFDFFGEEKMKEYIEL